MSSRAAAALAACPAPPGKTAVVIGGTRGIGAALAARLARAGVARLVLAGRGAADGAAVVDQAKAAGASEVVFVRCDVGTIAGMHRAVDDVRAACPDGIDYLFQTQNGVPTGAHGVNADGLDPAFAVQIVSRFVLTYRLSQSGLNAGAAVVSVCNPGQDVGGLDVDDLALAKRGAGLGRARLFMLQSARDSAVHDAFWEELPARFPHVRYVHVWPGLVATDKFDVSAFPFPLDYGVWLGLKLIGQRPDVFAAVPVYLALRPEGEHTAPAPDARYVSYRLGELKPGKWAADPANRQRLWAKLVEITGVE